MFSRLNVRTKLLVMLLPAALGLAGLAGLGVQTRLDDRQEARDARDAADAAMAATRFVHRVQIERVVAAVASVSPSDELADQLTQRRADTDDAGRALVGVLDRIPTLATGDTASDVDALRRGVAALEVARRTNVDGDQVAAYGDVVRTELGASGRLELATSREGAGRRWLARSIEADTTAAARIAALFSTSADPTVLEATAETAETLIGQSEIMRETFTEYASPQAGDQLVAALGSRPVQPSSDVYDAVLDGRGPAVAPEVDADAWPGLVEARLAALASVESAGFAEDVARLDAATAAADSSVVYFAAGAAGSIFAVLLLAFGLSRQITGSLRTLTDAAREISEEQVPQLVANLRSGTGLVGVRFAAVDTGTRDELAAVGDALNDLGRAMEEVATEQQHSLRKGISDIFVNLARRNQTLLDRQIQFIDRLEANEEDPDQLEHLFHLDHLATRMRRNAESLLVLAGAEAPRRRARDVAVGDVLRVAMGEVEDFSRISLSGVEDADITGAVAVDLAHLLAELMENGAQYSPPDRAVDVVGHCAADGGYTVTITDHGVGMAPDRVDAANRLLASPPPVGLALSRTLGFVVAGTLAERHGVRVRLVTTPGGGITAEVTLPPHLLRTPEAAPASPGSPAEARREAVAAPARAASVRHGWNAAGEYVAQDVAPDPLAGIVFSPERLPEGPAPAKLVDVLPEGSAFDEGLYSLLGRPAPPRPTDDVTATPDTPAAPTPPVNWVGGAASPWAQPMAHPRATDPATPTGPAPSAGPATSLPTGPPESSPELPRRRPAGETGIAPGTAPAPGTGAGPSVDEGDEAHTAAPRRPADEVRSVLYRYRSGLESGRVPGPDGSSDPAPVTDPATAPVSDPATDPVAGGPGTPPPYLGPPPAPVRPSATEPSGE